MNLLKNISFSLSFLLIISCGGGGGGGSAPAPTPSAPVNPPISITISSSLTSPLIGDETTLTWSTSNATSCSATGSWSGDKGTSGSETLKLTISGNITFGLSCTSSSLSGSKSLTIAVTPALNAYAYINGPTTFSGFYVHAKDGYKVSFMAVEVDMDINDNNSLFITAFRYSENRFLGFQSVDGVNDGTGLRFGDRNYNVNEDGEQVTYRIPLVSTSFHSTNQVLLNTDSSLNPYTYDPTSFDDLEQFNADITLSFEEAFADATSQSSIKMSTVAFPKDSENSNDATFVGSSKNDGSWSFLYIVDKREVEKYSDNLVSESDIFNISWGMSGLFTSFLSKPNFEIYNDGIKVTSNRFIPGSFTTSRQKGSLTDAREASLFDATVSDNTVTNTRAYAVKYMQPETTSKFRGFKKYNVSNDCSQSGRYCSITNPQFYFFEPSKESLIGFKIGGYWGEPEETVVRFLTNID